MMTDQNDSRRAKLAEELHQKREAALSRARNYIVAHTALSIEEPNTPENPMIGSKPEGVRLYHRDLVHLVTWIDELRKRQ